jgi:hypothetical protein
VAWEIIFIYDILPRLLKNILPNLVLWIILDPSLTTIKYPTLMFVVLFLIKVLFYRSTACTAALVPALPKPRPSSLPES